MNDFFMTCYTKAVKKYFEIKENGEKDPELFGIGSGLSTRKNLEFNNQLELHVDVLPLP